MTKEKTQDTATQDQKVEPKPDAMMVPEETVFEFTDQDGNVEVLTDERPDEEGGKQPEGAGEAEKKEKKEDDSAKEKGESEPPEKEPEGKPEKKADEDDLEGLIKPDDPKGVKKRIGEIVKEQRQTERERDRLLEQTSKMEERIAALEAGKKPDEKPDEKPAVAQKPEDERPKEPDEDDDAFEDYGQYKKAYSEYLEKLTDWKAERAVEKALQKDRDAREQAEQEKREKEEDERYEQNVAEGKKKYEDFEEVAIDNGLTYTDAMTQAIVGSEIFVELAYHLGGNPDEVERIAALTPVSQIREIGRIEERLQAKPPEKDKDKSPSDDKSGKKRTTTATEPIKPVSGAGGGASYDPNTASLEEYIEKEDARERKTRFGV